jgi:hypothetical protein
MKTNISVTAQEIISFVTPVTKIPAGQGWKPGAALIGPRSYSDGGRLRGTLLMRFVARQNPNHRSGL